MLSWHDFAEGCGPPEGEGQRRRHGRPEACLFPAPQHPGCCYPTLQTGQVTAKSDAASEFWN